MGLFAKEISLTYPAPDAVDTGDIAQRLPDPGEALREWYLWATGQVPAVVEAEIERVHQPDGGYVLPGNLEKKGGGPLYLMSWIRQGDWIAVQVWAQNNERMTGSQKRALDDYVHEVVGSHGIPRAAACVMSLWASAGRSTPSLGTLAHLLSGSYSKHSETIPRGWSADVIKHWRR